MASTATAAETPRVLKPAVLRGRVFVQNHCVGCHNAMTKGDSVYAHAPPLRELGGRFTPAELQEVLQDVQGGDHYAMPPTFVTSRDALDVAAYIEALSKADKKTRRKLSVPSCVGSLC
ncbi:c-type cytochrome [Phenylobacterium sp. VNQ135]|uniref:c-type cytochrome n=1 Tax=Phenylobacterium sp. VNQ135 TaxID=3400922 RepID=UPI003BFC3DE4